jgi:RNA polymerase sigma-70 factor (ECF subfamily)
MMEIVAANDNAGDPIVSRCQQGDKTAFRLLFEKHRAEVGRLVYRIMGPGNDLEDVVQDVFIQVYRSIGKFRGNSRFSTWLHRLTVNVALMNLRAKHARPNLSDELPANVPASSVAPDDDAVRRERVRVFYELLDRMSEKKRTVFILHEIEGLSPGEIAEIVGAPALTVRTRLFYARRELIQLLREQPALAGLADVMIRPGSADLASGSSRETLP